MKQFYIRYELGFQRGEKPGVVKITVSSNPINDGESVPNNTLDFQDKIHFKSSTPEGVGDELERIISSTPGNPIPLKENFRYVMRGFGMKINRVISYSPGAHDLHSKIFSIYKKFVREHSPYSEIGE